MVHIGLLESEARTQLRCSVSHLKLELSQDVITARWYVWRTAS